MRRTGGASRGASGAFAAPIVSCCFKRLVSLPIRVRNTVNSFYPFDFVMSNRVRSVSASHRRDSQAESGAKISFPGTSAQPAVPSASADSPVPAIPPRKPPAKAPSLPVGSQVAKVRAQPAETWEQPRVRAGKTERKSRSRESLIPSPTAEPALPAKKSKLLSKKAKRVRNEVGPAPQEAHSVPDHVVLRAELQKPFGFIGAITMPTTTQKIKVSRAAFLSAPEEDRVQLEVVESEEDSEPEQGCAPPPSSSEDSDGSDSDAAAKRKRDRFQKSLQGVPVGTIPRPTKKKTDDHKTPSDPPASSGTSKSLQDAKNAKFFEYPNILAVHAALDDGSCLFSALA